MYPCKQNVGDYIGISMCDCLSIYLYNFSLTDELILIKLSTVTVYSLRMCI